LDFLQFCGENGIPIALVFTKADKLTKVKAGTNVENYLKVLKEQWEELPPYFVTSSERGTGREDLLAYIESINKELEK
jgi:GTP-binding protein